MEVRRRTARRLALATLQGGLLLTQIQGESKLLETALDALLTLIGLLTATLRTNSC